MIQTRFDGCNAIQSVEPLLADLQVASSVTAYDLDLLVQETSDLRQLDRQGNQPDTILTMQRHIDKLGRIFSAALKPTVRVSLAETFADATAIAGWAVLDRGQPEESWKQFGMALNAASFAQDRPLSTFVSAQRAYVLLELGKFDLAQDLVAEVLRKDRRYVPSELVAWLYGVQAEVAAVNGNASVCRESLDLGRSHLSYAGSSGYCPYVVLNANHYERWVGSCLAKLGDRGAIDQLETVRSEIHPDFARALGGVLVDLVQVYMATGEFDAAQAVFDEARCTTEQIGSIRQLNRLRSLSL